MVSRWIPLGYGNVIWPFVGYLSLILRDGDSFVGQETMSWTNGITPHVESPLISPRSQAPPRWHARVVHRTSDPRSHLKKFSDSCIWTGDWLNVPPFSKSSLIITSMSSVHLCLIARLKKFRPPIWPISCAGCPSHGLRSPSPQSPLLLEYNINNNNKKDSNNTRVP